jgi:hypothetical protein
LDATWPGLHASHGGVESAGAQRFGRQQTGERLAPVHASVFNHVNRYRDINRRAVFRANRAAALAD